MTCQGSTRLIYERVIMKTQSNIFEAYKALLCGKRVTIGGVECTLDEGSREMSVPHAEMACSYSVKIPASLFTDAAFEVEERPTLKPCPFCGCDDIYSEFYAGEKMYKVYCNNSYCLASITSRVSAKEVEEAWNRRAYDEDEKIVSDEVAKEVQEMYDKELGYVDCKVVIMPMPAGWERFGCWRGGRWVSLSDAVDAPEFVGYAYKGECEDSLSLSPRRCLSGCNNEAVTPVAVRFKKGE